MSIIEIINKELETKNNIQEKIKVLSHERININNKTSTESFFTNEISISPERLNAVFGDYYKNNLTVIFKNLIKNYSKEELQLKNTKKNEILFKSIDAIENFNKSIVDIKKNLNFGNKFNSFIKTGQSETLGKLLDFILNSQSSEDIDSILSLSNNTIKNIEYEYFKDAETFEDIISKQFKFKKENTDSLLNSDKLIGQALTNLSVSNAAHIYPNCFNSKNFLDKSIDNNTLIFENKNSIPILDFSSLYSDCEIDNIKSLLTKNNFNIDKLSNFSSISIRKQNERITSKNYDFNKNSNKSSSGYVYSYLRSFYSINSLAFPKIFDTCNINNNQNTENPGVFLIKRLQTDEVFDYRYDSAVFFIDNGLHATSKNRPTLTNSFFYLGETGNISDDNPTRYRISPYNNTLSSVLLLDVENYLKDKHTTLYNNYFSKWNQKHQEEGDINLQKNGLNRLIISKNIQGFSYDDNIDNVVEGNIYTTSIKTIDSCIVFNMGDTFLKKIEEIHDGGLIDKLRNDSINTNFLLKASLSTVEENKLCDKFLDFKDNTVYNRNHYRNYRVIKDFGPKINFDLSELNNIINSVFKHKYTIKNSESFSNRYIDSSNLNDRFNFSGKDLFRNNTRHYSNISNSKYKFSKALSFHKKPFSILNNFSEKIDKILDSSQAGLLYSENSEIAIHAASESPFLENNIMKNNFLSVDNFHIKSTDNVLYENINIEEFENIENIEIVRDVLKNNFKKGMFKTRLQGFKKILSDNINAIHNINYDGSNQIKNKDFLFEKLLCKTISKTDKNTRKEIVKMIIYSILNTDFDSNERDQYTLNNNSYNKDNIIDRYENISNIINFNLINKEIFSMGNLSKMSSYLNFKVNGDSRKQSVNKSLTTSNQVVIRDQNNDDNTNSSQKYTQDLTLYNHSGTITNILPDGSVKNISFGKNINSWFGLEYRNNFDNYISAKNSGIISKNKISYEQNSNSPYFNFSCLYFDPENQKFESLNRFFNGTDILLDSDDANKAITYRSNVKKYINENKELISIFPYMENSTILKNNYYYLAKNNSVSISNKIKSYVSKILIEYFPKHSEFLNENNERILEFFQNNDKMLSDIGNILELYCTILDDSLDILTNIGCFKIMDRSTDKYNKKIDIRTKENSNFTYILSALSWKNKETTISDLKKLNDRLDRHEFNSPPATPDEFTPDLINLGGINLENNKTLLTRRFFNLQEIASSLVDTDIMEALTYDIYTSYILNFEKNKKEILKVKDQLSNIVENVSDIMKVNNDSIKEELIKNFGNKNYLNYLSREINNIRFYDRIQQDYLINQKRLPIENAYEDFDFNHRYEEKKAKIDIAKESLDHFIQKTGNSNNVDIVRIGISKEIYNSLHEKNIIKLIITPYSHSLPDFIFKDIIRYYSPLITNVKQYKVSQSAGNKRDKLGFYINKPNSFLNRYMVLNFEEVQEKLRLLFNNEILSNNILDSLLNDHYTSNCVKSMCEINQKIFDETILNDINLAGLNPIDPTVFSLFENMPEIKFYSIFGENKNKVLNITENDIGYFQGKLMSDLFKQDSLSQKFIEVFQKDITNIDLSKKLKEPEFYDIFSIVINKSDLELSQGERDLSNRINNDPNAAGNLNIENILLEIKNNFTFTLKAEIL